VNVPVPLMVEPKTISPTFFSRGILSPFMVDSSMLVEPLSMIPSVGT